MCDVMCHYIYNVTVYEHSAFYTRMVDVYVIEVRDVS